MLVRPPNKYSLSEVFLGRGGEPISQYTTITFGRGRTNICYNTHAQFFLGGGRTNMFRPIRGREIISDTQTENQHTVRPCSLNSACKIEHKQTRKKIIFVREPGFGFGNVRTIYLDNFA